MEWVGVPEDPQRGSHRSNREGRVCGVLSWSGSVKRPGSKMRSCQLLPLSRIGSSHLQMVTKKPGSYRVVGCLALSRCFEMLTNGSKGEGGEGPVFDGDYSALKIEVSLPRFFFFFFWPRAPPTIWQKLSDPFSGCY